jgi:hypothetical protein
LEQQLLAWDENSHGDRELGANSAGSEADALRLEDQPGVTPLLVAPALFVAGASSSAPGVATPAPLRVVGGEGGRPAAGLGGPASRLAPLSGLQPQPLQSRLVQNTSETPGEQLMLK